MDNLRKALTRKKNRPICITRDYVVRTDQPFAYASRDESIGRTLVEPLRPCRQRTEREEMLNRSTFIWLFENCPRFTQSLAQQLNERMGQFIAAMESDRLHDPAARVARHLAWLFNPILYPSTRVLIEITHEELALLAGLSRQVANKALASIEATSDVLIA
ncbi:hypothetical protein CQ14_29330 [Bradyrhizobium lablabi]|uniref:Crp/Fnr family transcriptional regulator n=1 Tax=Bradyrhizobium lablabi TaxID=722472 RepID=A0A0R3N6C3_9BRAD|nr:hypothetical protein CQ14_29330 [Bradyrhizobium lablabi]